MMINLDVDNLDLLHLDFHHLETLVHKLPNIESNFFGGGGLEQVHVKEKNHGLKNIFKQF